MERTALMSVLKLGPGATTGEVRSARRLVARAAHPDAGGKASTMSAINAACDEWIAEIRRARQVPPSAPVGPPAARRGDVRGRPLRPIDVVATLALLVVIAGMVAVSAGPSAVSVAVGLLAGACAAAVLLAVLRWSA